MTRRRPLVYVAGPYTHPDPVENTHRAVRAGLDVRDRYGVAVLIPHLTLAAHLVAPRPVDYWYDFDLDQLASCDAVVRLSGKSTGADREVDAAINRGLPVFHRAPSGDVPGLGVLCDRWASS